MFQILCKLVEEQPKREEVHKWVPTIKITPPISTESFALTNRVVIVLMLFKILHKRDELFPVKTTKAIQMEQHKVDTILQLNQNPRQARNEATDQTIRIKLPIIAPIEVHTVDPHPREALPL